MMNPREVLAELERGNIVVYWLQNGFDSLVPGTRIEAGAGSLLSYGPR
jgi:hypothetical protein